MKNTLLAIITATLLSGCIITTESISTANRSNLNKLTIGLSKADVLALMGTTTIKTINGVNINHPYKTETKKIRNDKGEIVTAEVVFYYTDEKIADAAINDDELTPMIFTNGKLEGWGWTYLKDTSRQLYFGGN
jgi:outer membrane protein assembly factor BamE (lipoprotein component of BamABCDE complex)